MNLASKFEEIEEIVFLAVELSALDSEDGLDPVLAQEIVRAVELHGAKPAVAGMIIMCFSKLDSDRTSLLWSRLPVDIREDLARLMLVLQPEVTVRSLGSSNLCTILGRAADAQFHDRIAAALSSTFVPKSDSCLELLFPAARETLALALAERSGREARERPDFLSSLPLQTRQRAVRAMAFGALIAYRRAAFAKIAADFSLDDWEALMVTAKKRAGELGSDSISILLACVPDQIPVATKSENVGTVATRAGWAPASVARPVPGTNDPSRQRIAEASTDIMASAKTATAEELPALLQRCFEIRGQTWRCAAQSAIMRRAFEIRARVTGSRKDLSHEAVGAVIAEVRLGEGNTSILGRGTWRRIRSDRQFTLLSMAISQLENGTIAPTETRLGDIAEAILSLRGAMRDVLAVRFVTNLGPLPEMTIEVLARFSDAQGLWQDDVIATVARSFALRGQIELAHQLMDRAQCLSEKRVRDDSLKRLGEILENPSSIPTDKIHAVVSVLATVSDFDLKDAVALCFERLPSAESKLVLADVIARGRAADAFADTVFAEQA